MDKNPIPSFLMREAGLLVHFVESIHCGEEVFHESHSLIIQEDYIEIRISLRLYFIFSYLPTWNITPEDIENIDHFEAIFLIPDSTFWDPYRDSYEEEENNFINHKGDMIYPQ